VQPEAITSTPGALSSPRIPPAWSPGQAKD